MPSTLTWTARGPYTFTIAGANPTVAEVLAALNTLITANCTMWAVSQFSSVNGTLELKRTSFPGVPVGEVATVRMLIFGGGTPHANALFNGATAGATTGLYAGLSVDANTTGPSASYTAGAPYSTKYTRGVLILAPSTSLTTANTVKITLYESDEIFGFSIGDSTVMGSCFMGRLIVDTDGSTTLWGVMPSGVSAGYTIATIPSNSNIGSSHPITPFSQTAAAPKGACWETTGGGSAGAFGRMFGCQWSAGVEVGLGASGAAGTMMPVPIVRGAQAAAPTPSFGGYLRQIRFGPIAAHLNKLRNVSSVLQGTHVLSGTATGFGLWLDELP